MIKYRLAVRKADTSSRLGSRRARAMTRKSQTRTGRLPQCDSTRCREGDHGAQRGAAPRDRARHDAPDEVPAVDRHWPVAPGSQRAARRLRGCRPHAFPRRRARSTTARPIRAPFAATASSERGARADRGRDRGHGAAAAARRSELISAIELMRLKAAPARPAYRRRRRSGYRCGTSARCCTGDSQA